MSSKGNRTYVPLHTVEDNRNEDLSTSNATFLNETKDFEAVSLLNTHSESNGRKIQVQLKFGRVASFLVGMGITLCIGLLVFSSVLWQELKTLRQVDLKQIRPIPNFAPISRYWQPDEVLGGPPSEENDEAWNTLMPDGRGFVPAQNASSVSGSTVYSISAYHQIHCLFMIKEHLALSLYPDIMSRLRNSSSSSSNDESTTTLTTEESEDRHSPNHLPSGQHIWHCVEYLRQTIMCLADSTLEPLDDEDGGASGWHATHECRNWDALYDWAQAHGNDTSLTGIHG